MGRMQTPREEKKQTPKDGFECERVKELENRVARLEVNGLKEGWLQDGEDLEARISRLEVAWLDGARPHVTEDLEALEACFEEGLHQSAEADAMSNPSCDIVVHSPKQQSKWADTSLDLANSVSASPEGVAVQPASNGSQSRLP